MQEALYYKKVDQNHVRCILCPHMCMISEGDTGACNVRRLKNGKLIAETFGRLSAVANDPIEKKPLYHFYPGRQILSIGSFGCTMQCQNCQNYTISQCQHIDEIIGTNYSVKDLDKQLSSKKSNLIAFTYNEPVVFFEFMLQLAKVVTRTEAQCVMVSNGFINQAPLKDLIQFIAAFNIDLKSYSDGFYRKICGASLKPILSTIELIKQRGKHLEITYLVIPGLNDDTHEFKKLVKFLSKNYGRSQVLHISRYFPKYKMKLPPTPMSTINELTLIAKSELDYVYTGNTGMEVDANTYCPGCGNLLIKRQYYASSTVGLRSNKCSSCNKVIYGKFD